MISASPSSIPYERRQVTLDGQPVNDPHFCQLYAGYAGRRHIRRADFDQGKPLVFDLGVPVIPLSFDGTTIELDAIRIEGPQIKVGPTLIGFHQELAMTFITDGEPNLTCRNWIAGVKVKQYQPQNWQVRLAGFAFQVAASLPFAVFRP